MLEMNPIVLPVGSHVHISLQATKHTRLAYDQLGRPTCFHRELKYFNNYTYASCQAECQIDTMLNLCNCTGVTTYGRIPQDRVCSPKKSLYCYKELAYSFTDLGEECRRINCTEACTYWSYKATQTVGKVFNPILKEKMVDYWRLPNNSDPKLSLIFADIYFTDIEYTDIQQMPAFNIETFISSIGGAMGLWTGASIVTWIHLMYFCIACLCHHKKEMRDRSRNLSRLVSEEVENKLAIRLDQRITEKQAFLNQMQNGCVEGKD